MTDLLFGVADKYSWTQLKPWALSIRDSGFDGDVVLLVYRGIIENIAIECSKLDIEVLTANYNSWGQPIDHNARGRDTQSHQMRLFHLWQFLTQNSNKYRFVITTDTRDVVFQRNPSDWLSTNLVEHDLVAPEENIRYCDEPWGADNMINGFGPLIWEAAKNWGITNVGTIAGKAEAIRDVALLLYLIGENRYIPNDQSAWNIVAHSTLLNIKWAPFSSGWAFQAGSTLDPEKLERYRPHWIEPDVGVIDDDGYIHTKDGELYYLVHQWDRIPKTKKLIESRYND